MSFSSRTGSVFIPATLTRKKHGPAPGWEQLLEHQAKPFWGSLTDWSWREMSLGATGFKLLKSQREVIGVGGLALFSPNRCRGTAPFPIVHGFNPPDFPAIRFQLFNNGFPILRHPSMQWNVAEGSNSEKRYRPPRRMPRWPVVPPRTRTSWTGSVCVSNFTHCS